MFRTVTPLAITSNEIPSIHQLLNHGNHDCGFVESVRIAQALGQVC